MPDFRKALGLVLKYEGGRVDDPHDPGGRTAYGVTQATYDAFCKSCGSPQRDVWTITPAEVEAVYRDRYASAIRFDDLPDGVGFAVFDGAVNSGPKRAAEWLQAVLCVAVDGAIGPKTIEAAKAAKASVVIGAVCDARLIFLRGLSGWARYGHGWGSRVEDVRRNALAMAIPPLQKAIVTAKFVAPTPEFDAIRNAIVREAAVQASAKPSNVPAVTPYTPSAMTKNGPKPLQPGTWLRRLGTWLRLPT